MTGVYVSADLLMQTMGREVFVLMVAVEALVTFDEFVWIMN